MPNIEDYPVQCLRAEADLTMTGRSLYRANALYGQGLSAQADFTMTGHFTAQIPRACIFPDIRSLINEICTEIKLRYVPREVCWRVALQFVPS